MMRYLLILVACISLFGCGSADEGVEDNLEEGSFSPRAQTIQTLKIVDVSGNAIQEAEVTITKEEFDSRALAPVEEPESETGSEDDMFMSDSEGNIQLSDLEPGLYLVSVTLGDETVDFYILIDEENAITSVSALVPVSVSDSEGEITVTNLSEEGLFLSLSGLIYDENGPISGAQVSLSGGAETNGAINTAITDANGKFNLIINVNSKFLAALKSSTIRIVKDGYEAIVISDYDAAPEHNGILVTSIAGLNIQMTQAASETNAIYFESFNTKSEEGICGSWMAQVDAGLWHEHGPSLGIQNQAFVEELVVLAPNDTSDGYVPDPLDGFACWYGEASEGGVEQGNFLGEAQDNSEVVIEEAPSEDEIVENELEEPVDYIEDSQLGGTSISYNSGAIVSPEIDLTSYSAPLSLHFKTWWEIESVNPNQNGFDIMSIDYSDDGETWKPLVRLNPLSDPVDGDLDRSPIPFSNNGYNKAPEWINQEPIPLDDLAGKTVRLRIKFGTVDHLFNGFRGWLIDDIAIYPTPGSFPLFDESFDSCESYNEPPTEEGVALIEAETLPEQDSEIDPDYCPAPRDPQEF